MPTPEVEKRLEEIKAKQRKRGVIEPLVGRHWPQEEITNTPRRVLAHHLREIPRANANEGVHSRYPTYGEHYDITTLQSSFPDFTRVVKEKIREAKKQRTQVKWLDIGPGGVANFAPYFDSIDPHRSLITLHTISPEQILPRKKRTGSKTKKTITLSSGSKMSVAQMVPNPEYKKWKGRLRHHVGAIETYDPAKFKDRFHIIVSYLGGTHYTPHPHETVVKVARLLAQNGKAFLHTSRKINLDKLRAELGEEFTIMHPASENSDLVIHRTK